MAICDTSFNILNVLLKLLYLPPSLAIPFRTSVHAPLCCAFSSVGCTTFPQFHHSPFLPILHSGHKILLLFYSDTFLTIASFLPHSTYCTLVISPFLVSPSLQFHASWHEPYHTFFTCVMTNLLDDEETCNQWKEDLPLDNHYEIDYLRDERYDWVYNSLDEWKGAQESRWED